jgi:hypothetical protein
MHHKTKKFEALLTFTAMIAVLYFVDIYFTLVKAYTPSQAGIQLLYYTPGIGGKITPPN